jgi:hypothetical protein
MHMARSRRDDREDIGARLGVGVLLINGRTDKAVVKAACDAVLARQREYGRHGGVIVVDGRTATPASLNRPDTDRDGEGALRLARRTGAAIIIEHADKAQAVWDDIARAVLLRDAFDFAQEGFTVIGTADEADFDLREVFDGMAIEF